MKDARNDDGTQVVGTITHPQVEWVKCVVCHVETAKHTAYGIDLVRRVPATPMTVITWVWTPLALAGWSQRAMYYYPGWDGAIPCGSYSRPAPTHITYEFHGHACCEAHAHTALDARPWELLAQQEVK